MLDTLRPAPHTDPPQSGTGSTPMARPKLSLITCKLWRTRRRADGSLAFYYRVNAPGPDGLRTTRTRTVPPDVASGARQENAARRWIAEEEARLNARGEGHRRILFDEAVARFLDYKGRRRRVSTLGVYGRVLRRLAASCRGEPLVAVTSERVIAHLAGLAVGPETHNKHLRHLRAFFGACVRTFGWLARNPCDGIEPINPETVVEKPTLSDAEAARVVVAARRADADLGLAAWGLAEAGCRVGELLSRRWEDLEWLSGAEGVISGAVLLLARADTKGRRPRVTPAFSAPLTDALWRLRDRLRIEGRLGGRIFAPWRRRGNRWFQNTPRWDARYLNDLLARVCGDLRLPVVTSHGFRRTFSTAGADLDLAASDMNLTGGWSSRRVRDGHYTTRRALADEAIRAARRIADARRFGDRVLAAGEKE